MKRFLVFVLLFPLFCFISLILVIGLMPMGQMFEGLATAYIALLVPALVLAVLERFLKQNWTVGLSAVAGFAWLWALTSDFGGGVMLTVAGIGALSAALCWLIARIVSRRELAQRRRGSTGG